MKKGKRKWIVAGVALGVVILLAVGVLRMLPKPVQASMQSIEMERIPDGVYEGSYDNGIVAARVEVEVENHEMVAVRILEHRNGLGGEGEAVAGEVVAAQSVEVDTVAGATYSSQTILKAVENALRRGMEQSI